VNDVWAAVPVKGFVGAKKRLAALLSEAQRGALAAAMLEDVLAALVQARIAGILVSTADGDAAALARRYGARVVTEGAHDGHTGAVMAMARLLRAEGRAATVTMPGDIPAVTAAEIDTVVSVVRHPPAFVIAPARDELGSNAILCSPPDLLPLRFGDDSYFPHLQMARQHGVEPSIVRLPGIGLDLDHPADVRAFLAHRPRQPTRTGALLESMGF
jgi:2-phospho-L-lactate guanylyltransferase